MTNHQVGRACGRQPGPSSLLAGTLLVAAFIIQACASGPPPSATDLGWSALEAGDWRGAETHFAKALALDARDGRAWHGRAKASLAGRDPEAALRSLGQLAKVDPARFKGAARDTYSETLAAAVRARLDRNQSEGALVAARTLSALEPTRPGLASLLGEALIGEADRKRLAGDQDAALALYGEVCRVRPGALQGWVGAVEILLEKKRASKRFGCLKPRERVIRPQA